MTDPLHYLLVTHIPFCRKGDQVIIDETWANDLFELAKQIGPIRVAAPELKEQSRQLHWGPTTVAVDSSKQITFVGFPPLSSRSDYWKLPMIWWILHREVNRADVVHSSNAFPPYLGLLYAHHLAVRKKKKTVFVIAEDFRDMLAWEWVRTASGEAERCRRQRTLDYIVKKMEQAVSSASLTLLATPPAVNSFRLFAKNSYAFRDTTHRANEVIDDHAFEEKCKEILGGAPLRMITMCRHKPLKGLDFLIRAVAMLKQRDIYVTAHLYGEGLITPSLIALAERTGVTDRVFFPGPMTPGKKVFKVFHDAHLSAMPHRTNDFGRSFMESLTGGSPVVAFRTEASEGTVRDYVDGLLAPLDNVIALSLAIEMLHRDRPLLVRLAENARARGLVETKDSWHSFRAELIHELLKLPDIQ